MLILLSASAVLCILFNPLVEGTKFARKRTNNEATQLSKDGRKLPWTDPFLPDYIIPEHYSLYLHPNFYYDGSTYQGSVEIQLRILEATDTVIVHYKDMNIVLSGLRDRDNGNSVIPLIRAFAYDPNQYWVVQTQQPIPAGSNVSLQLAFNGVLTNGIVGFYKSTYVNALTGEQSWLATSKFQPSDARKAFPCFDEPRFRSRFTITTRHWSNFTALANMPAQTVNEIDSTWSETTFQTSPPMSSYLVCFIVCDFPHKDNSLQDGTPHKVWARPDRLDQVDYALWAGATIEDYFVDLFKVPYPLPKLDQVGIPDYPSGATEHWGLITYRETRLLYDPEQVSDYDRQRVLGIVAHEMAHNHVGNLVTCHYWDEIWLNEGFASYYERKGMVHADSTMYADGQYFTRVVQSVMGTDSLNSSRPVVVPITNPDEANAAFDAIAYDKGSALLSMMEGFLGSDLFNRAISRYLTENAFSTVVSDDLWASMQREVGDSLNMKEIMSTWIYSMGYPVIEISQVSGSRYEAKQMRFLMDPVSDPESPPSEYGYSWYVPLNYRTVNGTTGIIWLNKTNAIFDIADADESEWVKFNHDHTGFYRVNYPLYMWALFEEQLLMNRHELTDLERANLLSDALALARALQLPYDTALDLTKYLSAEDDFLPWDSVLSPFTHISNMLYTEINDYVLWQQYVVHVTKRLMDRLQIADDGSYVEKLTRTDIIKLSCDNNYIPCLTNTTELFVDWLIDDVAHAVPNNLKREVYAFGMWSNGDEEAWDTVWTRYTTATSGQEQDNLLYSLTRTQELTLIDRLLGYSMDESKIRSQDFFTVITYIQSNRVANNYLWNWVQDNYDAIVARFGLSNRSLGRMVPGIVNNYNTEEQLQEVLDFFTLHPDAGTGARFREEAIQNIQANIRWMDNNLVTLRTWLDNFLTPSMRKYVKI